MAGTMRMLSDRVLVMLDNPKEEDGGIVIPDMVQKTNQLGTVVEAGPDCEDVEYGDRVMVGEHSGLHLRRGGHSVVIIREEEILVVGDL